MSNQAKKIKVVDFDNGLEIMSHDQAIEKIKQQLNNLGFDSRKKMMNIEIISMFWRKWYDSKNPSTDEKYNELIMAVGNKSEGETRHETALRYIKQAEEPSNEVYQDKLTKEE